VTDGQTEGRADGRKDGQTHTRRRKCRDSVASRVKKIGPSAFGEARETLSFGHGAVDQ